MNYLYHFGVFPDQMGRFKPHQIDALEVALKQFKKDSDG